MGILGKELTAKKLKEEFLLLKTISLYTISFLLLIEVRSIVDCVMVLRGVVEN